MYDKRYITKGTSTLTEQTSPHTDGGSVKRPSWRDFLPLHLAAERLPLWGPDALRQLGEEIKKSGLPRQIVLFCRKGRGALKRGWNRGSLAKRDRGCRCGSPSRAQRTSGV
jgi:hypothetical protein